MPEGETFLELEPLIDRDGIEDRGQLEVLHKFAEKREKERRK